MKEVKNFINGKLTAESQDFLNIYNPSTGEIQGKLLILI